jgi:hypothetical protein
MTRLRKNLVGHIFGRLTVKSLARRKQGKAIWLCLCQCGKKTEVYGCNLSRGGTNSCGCLKLEAPAAVVIHGKSKSKVHRIWRGMLSRCNNPNEPMYPYYGGRGIKICDRWKTFINFYEDMGDPPPYHSIDRFPNNNGNYEPGNCRWATTKEQARNKRNNHILVKDGIALSLVEWSEKLDIKEKTLHERIRRKWPESRILESVRRKKA